MHSIRRRLLLALLITVLTGIGLAGWLIYRQAQAAVNRLFDYQLQQTAIALPSEPFLLALGAPRAGNDDGIVIQIWSRTGIQLYYSHPHIPLAPRAELGFSTEHTAQGDWRVYSAQVGENIVQVAQPLSVRNEIAVLTAWHTLWPLVLLLPILGGLVWFIVGRGLLPLRRVARAVDARHPDALEPMPEQKLPIEVQPLVQALNRLLTRLATALDTQKAFVADAAHELRTPLAALNLQLQLLERATSEPERQGALADLKQGVARVVRMAEQLLALARAETAAGAEEGTGLSMMGLSASQNAKLPAAAVTLSTSTDLRALLSEVTASYAQLALHRGLDLGFSAAGEIRVAGAAAGLRVLFNNLLDNALKYTPSGGRVEVSVGMFDGSPAVEICDTGPGIPVAERARVFDRFYRGLTRIENVSDHSDMTAIPGSGLGLAIVQRLAARYGATVELGEGYAGMSPPGLRVTVRFAGMLPVHG